MGDAGGRPGSDSPSGRPRAAPGTLLRWPPPTPTSRALDALGAHFDRRWLDSDPLRWPRTFAAPHDREVVAVVAALLAYGRVASIHRAVADVLRGSAPAPRRPSPRPAARRSTRRSTGSATASRRAPTSRGSSRGGAAARDAAGSLGAYVGAHARGPEPLRAGLASWRRLADGVARRPGAVGAARGAFLLADPDGGAACKRSLLLARWCVRPDDGLDLGLWTRGPLRPATCSCPSTRTCTARCATSGSRDAPSPTGAARRR